MYNKKKEGVRNNMEELVFEEVRFNPKYEQPRRVYIDFSVSGFPFYLCFIKKGMSDKWEAMALMHDGFIENRECPFCNNEDDDICFGFPVKLHKVVKDLLSQKEIRLKALMKGLKEENITY